MADNLIKAQRSFNMSRIRSSNTKLEQKFFSLLDTNSIEHIKHPQVYGKPDCQIQNILIFVDSDFWHGWHFRLWKERLPQEYWVGKIERNIKRDVKKFRILRRLGFTVLRIWGYELKNEEKVLSKIHKALTVVQPFHNS